VSQPDLKDKFPNFGWMHNYGGPGFPWSSPLKILFQD